MHGSKHFFLLLTSFFSFFSIISAQEGIPKLEYGIYKNEDLLMKQWEADTSAEAAILGHEGLLNMGEVYGYYGFELTVKKRIKIFKKSGFQYANVSIPYIDGMLVSVKGQTINTNGEKFPILEKDIFKEKLHGDLFVTKLTFPNVTEGCIIEYEFKQLSQNTLSLTDWYFQFDIPIRFSVLHLDLMGSYEFKYLFQGEKNLKSTPLEYDKKTNSNKLAMYVTDLPAIKGEDYITCIDNYRTRVQFHRSKRLSTDMRDDERFQSWENTEKEYLENKCIGRKYLDERNYIQVTAASKKIYSDKDSAMLKMQKIYNWVNKNITCEKYYGVNSVNTPNDVWRKKKAESYSDINYVLIAVLREAGLEANPVFISTRKNGQVITDVPIIGQFNNIIVAVELPYGKRILLDAGKPNLPFGFVDIPSLNYQGWLLRKGDSKWIDIKPTVSSEIMTTKLTLDTEGTLSGVISATSKGYAAYLNKESYNDDLSGKTRQDVWKKKYSEWQIDSIITNSFQNIEEPLREKVYLKIENAAQINDNLIYIKPSIKSSWEDNPFKLDNRLYPVEMPYPSNDQYTLSLSIPNGYKIEELPKPLNISLPPDDARFIYQASHDALSNTITVLVKIQINKTFFSPENYKPLRQFFSQISAKLGEMVVLKKV